MQNIFKDSAEYCKILAAPQSLSLNDEPSITAPLFLLLFTSATLSLSKGFTPLNPLNSSPGKVSRFYPFKCHPLLFRSSDAEPTQFEALHPYECLFERMDVF